MRALAVADPKLPPDERVNAVTAEAKLRLREHAGIAVEMAAIQKELERRVSLAKSHRGKPWRPPRDS